MRWICLVALLLACATATLGQECKVAPKCKCTYGDETVDVEEQSSSSELLAGAVGALGSMAVAGGGFGIWKLVTGRKGTSIGNTGIDGAESGKKNPPPYSEGGGRPPNIYSAGRNDHVNHRVGRLT